MLAFKNANNTIPKNVKPVQQGRQSEHNYYFGQCITRVAINEP